ncbi:uncharacterized protein IAS62_002890 [Cryptococcus decagattii]|uniref:Uncharacterized protein n=1 Tax=Cryptococcus decagattii TaxID=1859122 RepID=A0ABZ2AST2_9TREE
MTARPVVSLSRQIHSSAARRSQVGKVPIPIPPSVALALPASSVPPHVHPGSPEAHRVFTVSGPLGSTTLPISPSIILTPPTPSSSSLTISVHDPAVKTQRSLWGLTRTLISNAITGVSAGFNLEVKLLNRLLLYRRMLSLASVLISNWALPIPSLSIYLPKSKLQNWGIFVGGETIRLKEVKKK